MMPPISATSSNSRPCRTSRRSKRRLRACCSSTALADSCVRAFIGPDSPAISAPASPWRHFDAPASESRQASAYYLERRKKTSKSRDPRSSTRYPKAGIICDTNSHFILAVVADQGPGSDQRHYREAVDQACANVAIDTMAADAGYDSEASHTYARAVHKMRTLIPPTIGRPTVKSPTGYRRRQMKSASQHLTRYTQRWQVETVNSMLKRLLGPALRARQYWSRCRELLLRALTLNTMLLAEPP